VNVASTTKGMVALLRPHTGRAWAARPRCSRGLLLAGICAGRQSPDPRPLAPKPSSRVASPPARYAPTGTVRLARLY
jgi:hypothetical protein